MKSNRRITGNLMEDPSSPRIPLIHSLPNQSSQTPPIITAHPCRPTTKSMMVPPQVRTLSGPMVTSLLSLRNKSQVDVLKIMLVDFRPPAFQLTSFVLTFWHFLYDSSDDVSVARQVLPLSISLFVTTLWPSFNTPYLGFFYSASHDFDVLFLVIT